MNDRILLVHHFPLTRVTGVRALLSELLWRIPAVRPGTAVAYEAYEEHDDVDVFVRALKRCHADARLVVGVNVHVDVRLQYTVGLLDWCRETGRQLCVYVHDYWPKHRARLDWMVAAYGCRLLASTPFIRESMAADGLDASLVQVGVPLGNLELDGSARREQPSSVVIGSIGRLVPRKRFPDVVAAFGLAGLAGRASLRLRLVPSSVRGRDQDERVLRAIEAERRRRRLRGSVHIERQATERSDYRDYDLYACASSYEGFSMTPIEAAYSGCPPLMSDIPAHRAIAEALFPDATDAFLFATGDPGALARLMSDEIRTGRRAAYVRSRAVHIRDVVGTRWSPARTAEGLVLAAEAAGSRSAAPVAAPGAYRAQPAAALKAL